MAAGGGGEDCGAACGGVADAVVARIRAAEIDASYVAYDAHPLDETDAWGDLASFRRAAAAS